MKEKVDSKNKKEKKKMSEEIERHVVRKFEICQRLGKGVKISLFFLNILEISLISL